MMQGVFDQTKEIPVKPVLLSRNTNLYETTLATLLRMQQILTGLVTPFQ
jgi:hypothetical protein